MALTPLTSPSFPIQVAKATETQTRPRFYHPTIATQHLSKFKIQYYASRHSHEYSCEKKKEIRHIQHSNFFCFNNNASSLYNNDAIVYRIDKKSCENSLVLGEFT